MQFKFLVQILLACLLSLGFLASARELRFGQSCATAGPSQGLGQGVRDGILAAFKETPKVKGYDLVLETRDDGYEPVQTINNTQTFLSRQSNPIFSLLGYVGTPTVSSVLDSITATDMPLLTPFTGAGLLRNKGSDFQRQIVNLRSSYIDECAAMVNYAYGLGDRKFSILWQSDAFGQAGYTGLDLALKEKGLKIFSEGTYVRNTEDVEAGMASIFEDGNPDAVIMIGTYSPLAKAVKIGHARNKNTKYFTVSFVGSKLFAAALNSGSNGEDYNAYITQVVPNPSDRTIRIVDRYHYAMQVLLGSSFEPDFISLEGYLNGRLVIQALERIVETNITRANFLDSIYGSGLFVFGNSLQYGPYGDACSENSLSTVCDCNQGGRRVFLTKVVLPAAGSTSAPTFEEPTVNGAKYQFSFQTCGYEHAEYISNSSLLWIIGVILPSCFLFMVCISCCCLLCATAFGFCLCIRIQKQKRVIKMAAFVADAIARMDMEDQSIQKLLNKSLRKASVLERTLITIVSNLKEYRPYLPDHLFANEITEEDEKGQKIADDVRSIRTGVSGISSTGDRTPSLFSSSKRSTSVAAKKMPDRRRALGFNYRAVAVMVVDIPHFHQLLKELPDRDVLKIHSTYIDSVNQIIKGTGGVLNQILGDRLVCCWNAVTNIVHPCRSCSEAALKISKINIYGIIPSMKPCKLNVVCTFIPNLYCGNSGGQLRTFSLIGKELNMLMQLANWNKVYKAAVLCTHTFFDQVKMHFLGHTVDMVEVHYGKQEKKRTMRLFNLFSHGSAKHDEWMYELDQLNEMNKRLEPHEKVWEKILKKDPAAPKAIREYAKLPEEEKFVDDEDLVLIGDHYDEDWWRVLNLNTCPPSRQDQFGTGGEPLFKKRLSMDDS